MQKHEKDTVSKLLEDYDSLESKENPLEFTDPAGKTALIHALETYLERLEFLIAFPNTSNFQHPADLENRRDIALLLIKEGANVSHEKITPILDAIKKKNPKDTLAKLIEEVHKFQNANSHLEKRFLANAIGRIYKTDKLPHYELPWYAYSAYNGMGVGMLNYAATSRDGLVEQKRFMEAIYWLEKSFYVSNEKEKPQDSMSHLTPLTKDHEPTVTFSAHMALSRMYTFANDAEKALQHLTKAKEIDDKNPQLHAITEFLTLEAEIAKKTDPKQALEHYQDAALQGNIGSALSGAELCIQMRDAVSTSTPDAEKTRTDYEYKALMVFCKQAMINAAISRDKNVIDMTLGQLNAFKENNGFSNDYKTVFNALLKTFLIPAPSVEKTEKFTALKDRLQKAATEMAAKKAADDAKKAAQKTEEDKKKAAEAAERAAQKTKKEAEEAAIKAEEEKKKTAEAAERAAQKTKKEAEEAAIKAEEEKKKAAEAAERAAQKTKKEAEEKKKKAAEELQSLKAELATISDKETKPNDRNTVIANLMGKLQTAAESKKDDHVNLVTDKLIDFLKAQIQNEMTKNIDDQALIIDNLFKIYENPIVATQQKKIILAVNEWLKDHDASRITRHIFLLDAVRTHLLQKIAYTPDESQKICTDLVVNAKKLYLEKSTPKDTRHAIKNTQLKDMLRFPKLIGANAEQEIKNFFTYLDYLEKPPASLTNNVKSNIVFALHAKEYSLANESGWLGKEHVLGRVLLCTKILCLTHGDLNGHLNLALTSNLNLSADEVRGIRKDAQEFLTLCQQDDTNPQARDLYVNRNAQDKAECRQLAQWCDTFQQKAQYEIFDDIDAYLLQASAPTPKVPEPIIPGKEGDDKYKTEIHNRLKKSYENIKVVNAAWIAEKCQKTIIVRDKQRAPAQGKSSVESKQTENRQPAAPSALPLATVFSAPSIPTFPAPPSTPVSSASLSTSTMQQRFAAAAPPGGAPMPAAALSVTRDSVSKVATVPTGKDTGPASSTMRASTSAYPSLSAQDSSVPAQALIGNLYGPVSPTASAPARNDEWATFFSSPAAAAQYAVPLPQSNARLPGENPDAVVPATTLASGRRNTGA